MELEMNANLIKKLTDKNSKIMLQIINPDGTSNIEYVKSISDISKKLDIPYSTLINLYYICTEKGGGKNKNVKKKYIHSKYIELLKHIRIYDSFNESFLNDVNLSVLREI